MSDLALLLPGSNPDDFVQKPPELFKQFASDPNRFTLGFVISQFLNILFLTGGLFMFFWLVWGAFHYLISQGQKEELAKARARMTWALMGFMFLVLSFLIAQYAQTILPQRLDRGVTKVTPPEVIPNRDGSNNICTRQVISDCEAISGGNHKCEIVNGKAECIER